MRKRVIVVGATGSIGSQALDVLGSKPELFEVIGLSAHRDASGLVSAGRRFPGALLCLSGTESAADGIDLHGWEGLNKLLLGLDAEIVLNGASGSGGLKPSLAALASGADLALANKESIVMAWPVLAAAAKVSGARILPVDSEHSALFQLVNRVGVASDIEELVITASGGAFRDKPLEQLDAVTPDEAATHPNWSMGRKITIDSATMANKGLEVIETARLFGFDPARIKVLVHPQSFVHALVRTTDGNLYAQVSAHDMRLPIQNALTWPVSTPCAFGRMELAGKSLEFREPEAARYPLLGLAYECLAAGEGAPIAYNASDEIAVAAFEAGRIGYTDIARVVSGTLEHAWPTRVADLESIFEIDGAARESARAVVREIEC